MLILTLNPMFNRLSQPGIILDNMRSLSLGLTVTSLLVPLFQTELFLMLLGVLMGGYYGYRIEKETHNTPRWPLT